jgi:hypothetical protein
MSCASNIVLTPCVNGDTWDGLTDCSFSSDGTAFSSPLSQVRMFFKNNENETGLELTSAAGTITIDNAAQWMFTVNQVNPMTLDPGLWYWSIETTDSQGVVKTRVFGILEIISDPTQ